MGVLFLLRHAKAIKAKPGMRDIERPLEKKGHQQSADIGKELLAAYDVPAAILCSASVRTRETLAGLGLSSDLSVIHFSEPLFDADAKGYLSKIKELAADSLLVVGHNPSITEVAVMLAGGGDAGSMARVSEGFPTAGLAILTFQGTSADLRSRGARLEAFLAPQR